jgi:two-component system OmpR family sensor kinase/two-component system phosphate regulon sensor histidine kinase PhoR
MAIQRKRSFRSRIFISFFAAFSLFTVAILLFQYDREKKFKAQILENTLDNITTVTNNFIVQNKLYETKSLHLIDSIKPLLPGNHERITIISDMGKVLYDSSVYDILDMENHMDRSEVQKALYSGTGSSIRHSATTDKEYYYYAKHFNNYFVRTAILYDVTVKDFLKTERVFLIFIIFLFLLMWGLLNLVTLRLGHFIDQLHDFAMKAATGEKINTETKITDNELNTIKKQIIHIYNNLTKTKSDLISEKEKLFQHMNTLQEGISFFNSDKTTILSNSHFIQYINSIAEKSSVTASNLFNIKELNPMIEFINEHQNMDVSIDENLPRFDMTLMKNEYYFEIRVIIFGDKSFEVLIADITKLEKRRLLKQQLTANIAHELKTPVASMRGYLETIMNNKNIPEEKKDYFIERAFIQSERLTELLNDVSLLNNIEDAGDLFEMKPINILNLIEESIGNYQYQLSERLMTHEIVVDSSITVTGNDSLLSSIFKNLTENSIKYAGEKSKITIKCYHSDTKYHYFSFADSGSGISEEHLPRIFERFYRTDEGRSRKTGGTGLGLAIVKNAVLLHKGEISVKNRPEGGLEFLFSIARS